MSNNPLLDMEQNIRFADILPQHIVPAVEKTLAASRQKVTEICYRQDHDFQSLVGTLDQIEGDISRILSPIYLLYNLRNSEELRQEINKVRILAQQFDIEVKIFKQRETFVFF